MKAETLKRIENLEKTYPGQQVIIDVCYGSCKQPAERFFPFENNRHEFWNPETQSWQDTKVKEFGQ